MCTVQSEERRGVENTSGSHPLLVNLVSNRGDLGEFRKLSALHSTARSEMLQCEWLGMRGSALFSLFSRLRPGNSTGAKLPYLRRTFTGSMQALLFARRGQEKVRHVSGTAHTLIDLSPFAFRYFWTFPNERGASQLVGTLLAMYLFKLI